MSMTDRDKAFSLRDLDDVIVKFNERNKKGATTKIEVKGFYGDYLEVAVRVCAGFETYKKITLSDMTTGIQNGVIYVVNPSFVNKYYKQKWYTKAMYGN